MLRVSPFLLAASAAALPTTYLRPLERDLRDMEVAIKALHAKAAHKALRLEKYANAFEEKGYDDLEYLLCMSERRLLELALEVRMRPGHVKKLLDWRLARPQAALHRRLA